MQTVLALLSETATGTASVLVPMVAVEHVQGESLPAAEPGFELLEHRRSAFNAQVPAEAVPIPAHQTRSGGHARRSSIGVRLRLLPLVRAAELRHRLPAGLLDALIAAESAYIPWAVSSAGAGGLAQLMPATAAELGVFDRFDPFQSINGGARYLRRMLDRFGSVSLALAAYNAGPGSVLRAGGIPFNGETPGYVARVLRIWRSRPFG